MTNTDTPGDEVAVATYLRALNNPSSLIDEDRLTALREKLTASTDPLERLGTHSEIRRSETPPLDEYERAFTQHAKAWADPRGIAATDFLAEGVDPSVLRRSGFNINVREPKNVRGPKRARQTRAAQALVEDYIASKAGEFSITQAAEELGIHPTTVRKYLKLAITTGLAELTDSRRIGGSGRPTNFYSRTRS